MEAQRERLSEEERQKALEVLHALYVTDVPRKGPQPEGPKPVIEFKRSA